MILNTTLLAQNTYCMHIVLRERFTSTMPGCLLELQQYTQKYITHWMFKWLLKQQHICYYQITV